MTGIWSDAAHWLSDEAAIRALAPTGRLRAGIAVGKARSALWASRDASRRAQGVTVEIARHIAELVELPLDLVEYESSGAVIAGAARGEWDVAFAPVDEKRKTKVLFGAAYHLGESTCMVKTSAAIARLDDLDRPDVKIVGVEDTATIRSARRVFAQSAITGVTTLDEALALFSGGQADALALGRDALRSIAPAHPAAVVLDGRFHEAATAVAVPKGATEACELVSALIEDMKADGSLRRAFDRAGLTEVAVAPFGARP